MFKTSQHHAKGTVNFILAIKTEKESLRITGFGINDMSGMTDTFNPLKRWAERHGMIRKII